MKQIGVGIIGFGTVGAGVAEGLLNHREVMAQRLGVDIVLRKIADLDITTDRGFKVPDGVLTTDANEAIADENVQIVVETVGGTGIAKKFVLDALNAGKCVVTAN
jgi:homoserine dehydrogenase